MAKQAEPKPVPREREQQVVVERLRLASRALEIVFRWREVSILVVGIALVLYFGFSNSAFVSQDNIRTIAQYAAAPAILAAGEVMLLICGEIDLSVGNIYALAPFIMYFANQDGMPLWVGVVIALLLSGVIGLTNGLITVLLKVPSFVTTLGMVFLLNGITLTISNGFPVITPGSKTFTFIMGHAAYSEIIWAIGVVILTQIILSLTPWGVRTIATGGNPVGASEAGVNIGLIKTGNFVFMGVLAGLTGILEAVRIGSTDPTAGGTPIMFTAVVAAVIGGTSLLGGSGTIIGGFIGALVLAVLQDGFTLQGISAFTFDIILGAAILVAMIFNVRLQQLGRTGR
jgi:simple sugar transport system permease protein